MLNSKFETGLPSELSEVVAFQQGRIVSRNLLIRPTGSVTVFAFAEGEETVAAISKFYNLIQVIDGAAWVQMNDRKVEVKAGQILVIPAHTLSKFMAKVPFKMVSITIKSGFEDAI
jgi:quercetin dioxygenase-like cupin family protein